MFYKDKILDKGTEYPLDKKHEGSAKSNTLDKTHGAITPGLAAKTYSVIYQGRHHH